MKIVKVKAPKLSKKQFNVLASNRNVMDINKLQLEIAQQNAKLEENPESAILQFETTVNVIQKTISCLASILQLDDEQKKALEEEYDNSELFELSDFLYFRLYGMSEDDYKKLKESQLEETEGLEEK